MKRVESANSRLLGKWLVGMNAALAALLAMELTSSFAPSPFGDESQEPAARVPDVELDVFALPGEEHFSALAERPMFSNTRRPFVALAEQPIESAALQAPPGLSLLGTVISQGKRSALFLTRAQEFIQLDIGMSTEGWELVDLSTDVAVLQRGDTRYELALAQ